MNEVIVPVPGVVLCPIEVALACHTDCQDQAAEIRQAYQFAGRVIGAREISADPVLKAKLEGVCRGQEDGRCGLRMHFTLEADVPRE